LDAIAESERVRSPLVEKSLKIVQVGLKPALGALAHAERLGGVFGNLV
jgi:hypothetical protein